MKKITKHLLIILILVIYAVGLYMTFNTAFGEQTANITVLNVISYDNHDEILTYTFDKYNVYDRNIKLEKNHTYKIKYVHSSGNGIMIISAEKISV